MLVFVTQDRVNNHFGRNTLTATMWKRTEEGSLGSITLSRTWSAGEGKVRMEGRIFVFEESKRFIIFFGEKEESSSEFGS